MKNEKCIVVETSQGKKGEIVSWLAPNQHKLKALPLCVLEGIVTDKAIMGKNGK